MDGQTLARLHPGSGRAGGGRDEGESFDGVMDRLQCGDEDAAAAVVRRLAARLNGLARTKLRTWVLRKVDPEDVIQSVFRSFFARCRAGQFNLASWDDLWQLLAVIAARKCANRAQFFGAKCRADAAEVAPPRWDGSGGPLRALDPGPTPFEAAVLGETVVQLLEGFNDDDRAIVDLSLQGYTTREISAHLGLAERTVRRLRERLKRRLERMQAQASEL
jgi:RNA polymerase sigma-70 factor (ECF subfamily)